MKSLYHKFIPYEYRYAFYKLRHPRHFDHLKKVVHASPKGNFSIRHYQRLQAIFIHITKTAGTSVALSLFNELPYHFTATEYRVIFGKKCFNDFFKFAFVRNPWSRLYSAFHFMKKGGWDDNDKRWAQQNIQQYSDFNDFVVHWMNEKRLYSHIHFYPQTHFTHDFRGRCLLNYLGYFETLQQDFNFISELLGINTTLQQKNITGTDDYRQHYNAAAIQKVAALYKKDINVYGYSFNSFKRKFPVSQRLFPVVKE